VFTGDSPQSTSKYPVAQAGNGVIQYAMEQSIMHPATNDRPLR
jgi:hypothetical protein